MKSHIRKIIDREKPRRGFHRSIIFQKPTKPAHYLGSMADTQTPEERKEREIAAKLKAYRAQQRLAQATPTGERCSHKACPYPAVLEGECRQHAADGMQSSSVLPSQLGNTEQYSINL